MVLITLIRFRPDDNILWQKLLMILNEHLSKNQRLLMIYNIVFKAYGWDRNKKLGKASILCD